MKPFSLVMALLFSLPSYATPACKCNCDPTSVTLCAMWYDLDHPCLSRCRSAPTAPMGRTACPVVKIFNEDKGVEEWRTICF